MLLSKTFNYRTVKEKSCYRECFNFRFFNIGQDGYLLSLWLKSARTRRLRYQSMYYKSTTHFCSLGYKNKYCSLAHYSIIHVGQLFRLTNETHAQILTIKCIIFRYRTADINRSVGLSSQPSRQSTNVSLPNLSRGTSFSK